ncbi:short chain dehydrogenase [Fonsecaea erecta]|uniref:Short chain dehydrogenase n=1 Tax=Fonsecaea erecta TaxID=1367422 RepID=A0A178ZC93_9EURO|nr:short chain dehydrogenase [Fonsecaea erecta]OAP57397.1 short chain dehydrogenase [Fonsecaea erecta]
MALHDGDLKPVRPMFELTGRNYIVTGGGRGIGYAITRAIAEMGGNVVVFDLLDKPVSDFDTLESEFGVKVKYIRADVTSDDSLRSAFAQAMETLGTLDGCVTAAGIAPEGPFLEQDWNTMRKVMDINVNGTYFTAQLAAQQMQKQGTGGSLILIASVCAHVALPRTLLSAYNASKGAVKMLSTALAVELAPLNIRCNIISPGYIQSDMTKGLREKNPELADIMENAPPLRRIGNRNDLTGAAVYLLSDASAYTTGAEILVTGGMHAGRVTTD